MGFRIEHPQPLIDQMRYGRATETYDLPAADYRLAYNEIRGGPATRRILFLHVSQAAWWSPPPPGPAPFASTA